MATVSAAERLNLAEIARREAPEGGIADIIDIISLECPLVTDLYPEMCNQGTAHESTRIKFRPGFSLRGYNQGVSTGAAGTEVVTEPTCMAAAISKPDVKLLQHAAGGEAAQRLLEDKQFLIGGGEDLSDWLWNGDRSSDPRAVNGIFTRSDYNDLDSDQVFDNAAGNCADDDVFSSIVIIQHGPKMVSLLYPRNDPFDKNNGYGVKMKPLAEQLVTDGAGREYLALPTWFEMAFGWFIYDPRCIIRIPNICTGADINENNGYFGFDEKVLISALNALRYNGRNATVYMNRAVRDQVWHRWQEKGTFNFVAGDASTSAGEALIAPKPDRIQGIPIHIDDSIGNDQADVTT
jgi:hypothetical protein